MKADTRRLTERIAHEVAALPEAQLEALAPALVEAWAELEKSLAAVLGTDMEARFTAQMYRRALIQLRPALEKLDELKPELFDRLMAGHRDAEELAVKHLVEQFEFYRDKGGTVKGIPNYKFDKSNFPIPLQQAGKVAEKALVDRYETSATRYTAGVRKDIRLQLARGMVKGETVFQMSRRIAPKIAASVPPGQAVGQALTRKYEFWAHRIVRTELINAYNETAEAQHKELAKEDPKFMNEWQAILDGRECMDCHDEDGNRVPVGAIFPHVLAYRPPAHPLCFVAGTAITTKRGSVPIEDVAVGDLVLTHHGRWRPVLATMTSDYFGPLVTVRAGQNVVCSTDDHPFLTPRGWIAAKELNPTYDRVYVIEGLSLEADDTPAHFNQSTFLLTIGPQLIGSGMPVAPINFDSDPFLYQRQVNQVGVSNRIAGHGLNTSAPKGLVDPSFIVGTQLPSMTSDHVPSLGFGNGLTPDSLMAGHGLGLPLLHGHSGVAAGIVLGDSADYASRLKDTGNGDSATAVALSQGNGSLTVKVSGNNIGRGQNDLSIHAIQIADKHPHNGVKVYNFEVEEDESYVANGIVVHNCRCSIMLWHPDWK